MASPVVKINELVTEMRQEMQESEKPVSFVDQLREVGKKLKLDKEKMSKLPKEQEDAVIRMIFAFGEGFKNNKLRRIREGREKVKAMEPKLAEIDKEVTAIKTEITGYKKEMDKLKRRVESDAKTAAKEELVAKLEDAMKRASLVLTNQALLASEKAFRERRLDAISASAYMVLEDDLPADTGMNAVETQIAMDLIGPYIKSRDLKVPASDPSQPDTHRTVRTITAANLQNFMQRVGMLPRVIQSIDKAYKLLPGATAGLSPAEIDLIERGIRPEEDVKSRIMGNEDRLRELGGPYGQAYHMPLMSDVRSLMMQVAPGSWSYKG